MQTKIKPTHHEIAEILIDERISDMTQFLMEDYNYTMEKALDLVYTSHTIQLLQIEEAELYVQSSAYVYDILIKELGLYPVYKNNDPVMVAEDFPVYSKS